jgi:hypothetical protein
VASNVRRLAASVIFEGILKPSLRYGSVIAFAASMRCSSLGPALYRDKPSPGRAWPSTASATHGVIPPTKPPGVTVEEIARRAA